MEKATKSEIKSLRDGAPNKGFKVIVTGKGGAGKTTTTSLLAQAFIEKNYNVLAVDEDPQINLPFSLGYPIEKMNAITPLSRNIDYIEEKIGVKPGAWGAFLKLNPSVDDVVERFGLKINDHLKTLVMGTITHPATGCLCPENALLDAVIRHIALRKNELILLDTQAGVEHFGRALAKGFSQCVIVTDSTFNAMSVATHSLNLAKEIGIPFIHLVINRADEKSKARAIKLLQQLGKSEQDFHSVFYLPVENKILDHEPSVIDFYHNNLNYALVKTIRKFAAILECCK